MSADAPQDGATRRARFVVLAVRALALLAVVGLVLAIATTRVVLAGEEEIAASTDALRAGDPHEATVRARRAAGWYVPGAPHVRVAYERLVALGVAAEGKGDRETALLAWRGVRSASLETRWLLTPHADDLARANAAIARLDATSPRPLAADTTAPGVLEQAQLDALLRSETPRTPWIVALLLGLVAWTSGALWAFRRGITDTGHFVGRRLVGPGVLFFGGVVVWLVALWQA